jgi:hypothetical protein
MSNILRRNIPMKKFTFILGVCAVILVLGGCTSGTKAQAAAPVPAAASVPNGAEGVPKVYFTADISPAGLMAVYEALGREANGRVAVALL